MNLTVQYPETPAGKRAVRANIYGNLVGYVSGRRFWEFGGNEAWNKRVADEWLQGKTPGAGSDGRGRVMDKVLVGTIRDGRRFFTVEREGRKMPLLDRRGNIEFWDPYNYGSRDAAEESFARVLQAMDKPEGLKDVTGPRS